MTEQSFRRFDGIYAILGLWTCLLEYCPVGGATLTDGLDIFHEGTTEIVDIYSFKRTLASCPLSLFRMVA